MPLSMGGGAAAGLETLFKRDREEELIRQALERQQANERYQTGQLDIQRQTSERLARSSGLQDELTEVQLGMLRRIAGGGGGQQGNASVNPNVTAPSHQTPTQVDLSGGVGVGQLPPNTPEGRGALSIAGINPNEVHGTIQNARPEQLTPEETFYQRWAEENGLQDWRKIPHQQLGQLREKWLSERPPSPMATNPFVVQVWDPVSGQARWATRGDAVGQTATPPAAQRERLAAYDTVIGLLDAIEEQGEKVGWKGLGRVEGPVDSMVTGIFGNENPITKAFSSDPAGEERLRALISELRARASFAEGGKQFTGTEKELVDAFLGGINQHPDVIRQRLQVARETAKRSRASLGAPGAGPVEQQTTSPAGSGGPPAPGGGGGADWYAEYLRRTQGKPGGGGI